MLTNPFDKSMRQPPPLYLKSRLVGMFVQYTLDEDLIDNLDYLHARRLWRGICGKRQPNVLNDPSRVEVNVNKVCVSTRWRPRTCRSLHNMFKHHFAFLRVAPNGCPGGAQAGSLHRAGCRARLGCSAAGPAQSRQRSTPSVLEPTRSIRSRRISNTASNLRKVGFAAGGNEMGAAG